MARKPQGRVKPPEAPEVRPAVENGQAPVATPGNVCVRFIKADAPYLGNHCYWCSPAEAEKLIRNGVAEAYVG